MILNPLLSACIEELHELKATDVCVLDINVPNSLIDYMIVATGNSSRHVRALSKHLLQAMQAKGIKEAHIEPDEQDEWILIDLGDIVVHIMQAKTRKFYQIEELWS